MSGILMVLYQLKLRAIKNIARNTLLCIWSLPAGGYFRQIIRQL